MGTRAQHTSTRMHPKELIQKKPLQLNQPTDTATTMISRTDRSTHNATHHSNQAGTDPTHTATCMSKLCVKMVHTGLHTEGTGRKIRATNIISKGTHTGIRTNPAKATYICHPRGSPVIPKGKPHTVDNHWCITLDERCNAHRRRLERTPYLLLFFYAVQTAEMEAERHFLCARCRAECKSAVGNALRHNIEGIP